MRSLLAALLLTLTLAGQAQAAILYMSGFESAQPFSIASASGFAAEVGIFGVGAAIQSSTVRSGGYALNVKGNFSNLFIDTVTTSTIACRTYVNFSVTGGIGQTLIYRTSTGSSLMGVSWDGLHLSIAAVGGFSNTVGTHAVGPGVWTRIDVVYDSAAGGVGKVYVNNALDITATHPALIGNVTRFSVAGEASTGGYFFDDVRCDTGLTPPPDGKIIARKGLSTTPIDNAFTKSSGSTIDTVWEIPWDPSTNANSGSTQLSLAQTMVIHGFSTTQAGMGSEVLTGREIINSVSIVAGVATSSTSSGGATGSIRRYVNGSGPSDTPITLSAIVNRLYAIYFTDTFANLDHYEIGWVKGVSTANRTHTVADILLMVDYFAPSVRIKVTQ